MHFQLGQMQLLSIGTYDIHFIKLDATIDPNIYWNSDFAVVADKREYYIEFELGLVRVFQQLI